MSVARHRSKPPFGSIAATFFPVRIEGEVTESGCNGEFQPVVHYETVTRQPMVSQFRKGATFRVAYALQKDKFDNPANSFWISCDSTTAALECGCACALLLGPAGSGNPQHRTSAGQGYQDHCQGIRRGVPTPVR